MLYRNDIQGLRAVALLLVLAAHWQVPYMSFGYIGVDIFFVISGYVITGLLLNKNQKIVSFYASRLRRLFPALFLMLFSVYVISIFLFPPNINKGNLLEANLAALWISNFHFAFSNQNYFNSGDLSLFLHTWSLGLEEQYYLIWPFVLYGLYRLSPNKIIHLLLLVVITSITLAIFCLFNDPVKFYYLLPTRIWQFVSGALVYFWFSRQRSVPFKSSGLVIVIMFVAAIAIYSYLPLVVINTLGVVLLTCYLLMCSESNSVVNRILSNSFFVAIGDRSYSLYLWHWPVWIMLSSLLMFDELWLFALVVFLTCLFSEISYRFVETPIRNSIYLKQRDRATIYLCFVPIVIFVLTGLLKINNEKNEHLYVSEYQHYRDDKPIFYRHGCDDWYESSDVKPCVYVNSKETNKTVVLIGDSVGAQWFSAILYSMSKDTKLVVYTKSACPILDVKKYYHRIGREFTECEVWRDAVLQDVKQYNPEVVFIGNSEESFDQEQWEKGLSSVLDRLTPITKSVVVLTPTPILSGNPSECLIRKEWMSRYLNIQSMCSKMKVENKNPQISEWIENVTKSYANSIMLNMNDVICNSEDCNAQEQGLVKYRDSQHLTNSYIQELRTIFKERLNKKINTSSFN